MTNSTPLYRQLFERPYPIHQELDIASIRWLFAMLHPQPVYIKDLTPQYAPMPLGTLVLHRNWFADAHSPHGIHGVRHLTRVAIFTWVLIQKDYTEWLSADEQRDLIQAAMVHDIMRHNDNADEEHGYRSAAWAQNLLPELTSSAIFAIRYHADSTLPTTGSEKDHLMLRILKTADALDRFRLPKEKWWPNPEIIPLPIDRQMLDFCAYVTLFTEEATFEAQGFDSITQGLRDWLQDASLV